MKLLIQNARLLSLRDGLDGPGDVRVEDGRIAAIGPDAGRGAGDFPRIDAGGLCLAPGLVDLYARVTEPSAQGHESAISLSRAAAAGGYTAVCAHFGACTPQDITDFIERAQYASCDLLPAARLTADGRELLHYGDLKLAGARAFYNEEGIDDPLLMRDALFRAKKHSAFLLSRCREKRLCGEGYIREGAFSRMMEVQGIPASAEAVMAARDLVLCRESGAPVHLAHVSTAATVSLIAEAKAHGLPVTCSTEPHYLALTSSELRSFSPLCKLDPPLGNPEDVRALRDGLKSGVIDCVASGHTPLTAADKNRSLLSAACGASSLETALPVCLTALYHTGEMPLAGVLDRLSAAPASLLGLKTGRLAAGYDADFVLFDPDAEWVCSGRRFVSRGQNTPFEGKTLRGRVLYTVKAGRVIVEKGALK